MTVSATITNGDTGARRPSGADHCIVFMCDNGYLFPTLVAAKMARRYAPVNTRVAIFLETENVDSAQLAIMEAASGASVQPIPESMKRHLTELVPDHFFEHTYLSRAALYRFFAAELAGDDFRNILYLDGDVQIRRPLADLFNLDLPQGRVGATLDWSSVHKLAGLDLPDEVGAYFSGLGFPSDDWDSYFNSGVMMASPETWRDIGAKALAFLVANPGLCRFHDQSALNHVCRGRLTPLSPRWNFLRGFMTLDAYQRIDPAIIHYTAKPKPWDGNYAPWGPDEFSPYVEMAQALEGSGVTWRRLPLLDRLAYRVKPLLRKPTFADRDYRDQIEAALLQCAGLAPAPHPEAVEAL